MTGMQAPVPVRDPGRADGSMSLLVDMAGAALDPAYAEAAARRQTGAPRGPRPVSPRVLAAVLLVGVATGVAATQVKQRADAVSASRRSLVADIHARTTETDRLADRAAALSDSVSRTRAQMLGADARGRQAAAEVAALELASGTVAVRGPGVVVTLRDAAGSASTSEDRGGQPGEGRIYDRDLQEVVNALWAAGAEAISVNDQRLTALTAIRSAGEAVLVDLRPLSPPYVLRAVGDPNVLEPQFVDSPTARKFQTWTSLYGIGFGVDRADDLRLGAASQPDLRVARASGGAR
jgi:uncharacterized protein YlxW (UPF0749 family)